MKDDNFNPPYGSRGLALRKSDAAKALGISDETFDKHVRSSLPVVRLGSTRIYPVDALERWLREHAEAPADELERRATGMQSR
jgi:phage terminase Nu1 subunit (DNA packaging protein)